MAQGIIDPVKVTRSAVQNAASIAGMLLTTETLVVEKPEERGRPRPTATVTVTLTRTKAHLRPIADGTRVYCRPGFRLSRPRPDVRNRPSLCEIGKFCDI